MLLAMLVVPLVAIGAALLALRERIEIDSIMEMPEGIWLEGAG